ncbi:hypothetical protein ACFPMF_03820 [Larkinella bovis]|uniref:Uncharacterized protein n=1 Tax=Larkinella bovis TaxID=683041 RepID=A0ABW0I7P4_9BACT
MKFYRLILQLICLLLLGGAIGLWARSFDTPTTGQQLKVVTIKASSEREMTDHLTDGLVRITVHEATVAPTLSHQTPLPFFAIIPIGWVLINAKRLVLQPGIPYYYFAYFRRLFGNLIAINAP